MNTATITAQKASEIMEAVLARGDLSQLNAHERSAYIVRICESLGLNPMTRPIEFITLSGRLVPYVRKDGTDQLRKIHGVSVIDLSTKERDGVYTVFAKVTDRDGRTDMATGAVHIAGLAGENLCNAIMRAETKSKRRATLSICGLGFLDESELPAAAPASSPQQRPRLADQLDALSIPTEHSAHGVEKRKRGRPKKIDDDDEPKPIDDPMLDDDPDLLSTTEGDDVPDYYRGKADAELGRKACLDSNIRDDEARFADWQRGYDSVKTVARR